MVIVRLQVLSRISGGKSQRGFLGFARGLKSVLGGRMPLEKGHGSLKAALRKISGGESRFCCRSRLVVIALDEEGLHVLVLQNLHGRLLGSAALRDREERLLRLRHHRARGHSYGWSGIWTAWPSAAAA